jgi:hypothetical protein
VEDIRGKGNEKCGIKINYLYGKGGGKGEKRDVKNYH